jgi:hypothetical protein
MAKSRLLYSAGVGHCPRTITVHIVWAAWDINEFAMHPVLLKLSVD